jgi:hypothetical protein
LFIFIFVAGGIAFAHHKYTYSPSFIIYVSIGFSLVVIILFILIFSPEIYITCSINTPPVFIFVSQVMFPIFLFTYCSQRLCVFVSVLLSRFFWVSPLTQIPVNVLVLPVFVSSVGACISFVLRKNTTPPMIIITTPQMISERYVFFIYL